METEKKKHGRPRKQKFFETTGMSYEGAINYALDKEVQGSCQGLPAPLCPVHS